MQNTIEIKALIIAEISGVINEDDQHRLHSLMDESPDVRALAADLYKRLDFEIPKSDQTIEQEMEHIFQLGEQMRKSRKKNFRIILAKYTTTAAALLIVLWLLTTHVFETPTQYSEPALLPNSKYAILRTETGTYELHGDTLSVGRDGRITTDHSLDHVIQTPSDPKQLAFIRVPAGKTYEIVLSDGSTMSVNSSSNAWFPLKFGKDRQVSVEGEAFITVAHDPGKSFSVMLDKMSVSALGTAFNINTYDPGAKTVSLFSGSVKVEGHGHSVTLDKGQMLTYTEKDLELGSFDPNRTWPSRKIYLTNVDETQIVEAFARYFNQHIVFDPPSASKRADIMLDRDLPVKLLLEQLPGGYKLKAHGDTIHLTK